MVERNSYPTGLPDDQPPASNPAGPLPCTSARHKCRSTSGKAWSPSGNNAMTRKRPFGVTLLLWVVLSLSAWGGIRFMGAIRWWTEMSEFEASLSPVYLSITGAGWALIGAALSWGLVSKAAWSRSGSILFVAAWLVEYWTVRTIFQSSRSNAPFALATSTILLAVTIILALHRSTIDFFISEEHEHPTERSTSA